MNHERIRALALSALLTLAGFAPLAHAQASAPAASSPRAATTPRRFDLVDQRIASLHEQLKITPAEARPWNAFARTIRDNAESMERAFQHRAQQLPTMNAEQALDSYADIAQLHARNMRALSLSFAKLYRALTPQQKQIADQLFRKPPHRR
jgi:hypothetical protein